MKCSQHRLPKIRKFQNELSVKIIVQSFIKFNLPMTLDALFCKDLMMNTENYPVRTFTFFSKTCYFHSTVWAAGNGQYLKQILAYTFMNYLFIIRFMSRVNGLKNTPGADFYQC